MNGLRACAPSYTRFPSYQPRSEPPDFTSGGKVAHFERVEWQGPARPGHSRGGPWKPVKSTGWNARFSIYWGQLRANDGVQVGVFNPLGRIGLIALNHLYPPF